MAQVKIGREFFAKSKLDYGNWRWALIREFAQNSIDCGSDRVEFCVELNDDGNTVLTVINDGPPMDRDILVNKLLCLGGSGKNFEGSVGGFGKAKELLYYSNLSYEIMTGGLIVAGSGADYEISEASDLFDGTRSCVVIEGDHIRDLVAACERFARFCQWSGAFVVNGVERACVCYKGSRRKDLDFGTVFTNNADSNTCVVRVNGIPMFTNWCQLNKLVVIEIFGKSSDVLTSNRDGLVYPFAGQLSAFITELAVDRQSALRSARVPRYEHFVGSKLAHISSNRISSLVNVSAKSDFSASGDSVKLADVPAGVSIRPLGDSGSSGGSLEFSWDFKGSSGSSRPSTGSFEMVESRRVVTVGEDFVLKNESGLVVPDYYRPDSDGFSSYSKKLVKYWGRVLLELHRLFDVESAFSVGFVFDEDCEAQFELSDSYGKVYYVSPAKIVEQSSTYSKSFKKRFKLTERDRLIAIALHEFVHGIGNSWHDEIFANVFTDYAAAVMKNRKSFNWCFQG